MENNWKMATTRNGSKMDNKPFVGFTSIDINDGISWRFWIAKLAPTFTAEALAVGETLEITGKLDSEENFMIFSDSESMLKGISNTSTLNNTSHITQMLKDKIEILELQGKKIQFYWIPGHYGVEVNGRAELRQSNQSRKAEIVNYYYYQLQILKPIGKRKAKRSFTISVKISNGTENKANVKDTTGMARLHGSVR
jgi:hypothetical protein